MLGTHLVESAKTFPQHPFGPTDALAAHAHIGLCLGKPAFNILARLFIVAQDIFFEVHFGELERHHGRLHIHLALVVYDLAILHGLHQVIVRVNHGNALGPQVFLQAGIVQQSDDIPVVHRCAIFDNPLDGGGRGAAVRARLDAADDVAVDCCGKDAVFGKCQLQLFVVDGMGQQIVPLGVPAGNG